MILVLAQIRRPCSATTWSSRTQWHRWSRTPPRRLLHQTISGKPKPETENETKTKTHTNQKPDGPNLLPPAVTLGRQSCEATTAVASATECTWKRARILADEEEEARVWGLCEGRQLGGVSGLEVDAAASKFFLRQELELRSEVMSSVIVSIASSKERLSRVSVEMIRELNLQQQKPASDVSCSDAWPKPHSRRCHLGKGDAKLPFHTTFLWRLPNLAAKSTTTLF